MLQLERQDDILRLLDQNREMTVKELCAELFCSAATVRRDLCELERRGLLKRSFGGAVRIERYVDQRPLYIRSSEHVEEKKRLASAAARLIGEGQTVFIDASTTTYFMAEHLADIPDVTVVTNNPYLSIVLSEMKIRSYCTGGEMLLSSVALVGADAIRYVSGMHADIAFLSCLGYDEEYAYDSSKGERDVKIAMIENAERACLLADPSKKGTRHAYRICRMSDVLKID